MLIVLYYHSSPTPYCSPITVILRRAARVTDISVQNRLAHEKKTHYRLLIFLREIWNTAEKMMVKGLIFCAIICATYVNATSAQRFNPWRTLSNRRRARRSPLDTRFMDIARQAFTSLVTEKGLKPNGKFHRAMDEIEKALATMQAQKGVLAFDQKTAEEFMRILERSAKSGNTESFREVLGRAIFHNMTRLTSNNARNPNAAVVSDDTKALLDGAKAFLSDIKQQIGKEHFEELISINGEVIV